MIEPTTRFGRVLKAALDYLAWQHRRAFCLQYGHGPFVAGTCQHCGYDATCDR